MRSPSMHQAKILAAPARLGEVGGISNGDESAGVERQLEGTFDIMQQCAPLEALLRPQKACSRRPAMHTPQLDEHKLRDTAQEHSGISGMPSRAHTFRVGPILLDCLSIACSPTAPGFCAAAEPGK